MKLRHIALALVTFGLARVAQADEVQPELGQAVLDLFSAFKNGAGAAVIVMAVIQILKTAPVIGILGKVSSKALIIVVPVLTVAANIVQAIIGGQSVVNAIIFGLFTAGGAMLLYDAIRQISTPKV